MLEVNQLEKAYRVGGSEVKVIQSTQMVFGSGEVHAIVGPSGSGKSTLLMILGALLQADRGQVSLNGNSLEGMASASQAKARARLFGYVFQSFHLLPYLSVRDNILLAGALFPCSSHGDKADALMARFGLSDRAGHVPCQLSQGEQQRVTLARALFNDPAVLVADEPTGNLDQRNSGLVSDTFRQFADQGGMVLLATHSRDMSAAADQVYTFRQKRLVRLNAEESSTFEVPA